MREVVLDTETTGLDFRSGDRIIEVGCVELKNHVPTGKTLQFYCKPDKKISLGAKKIVGIDSVEEAINAAKRSSKKNKIKNCTFICGDMKVILNDDFIK